MGQHSTSQKKQKRSKKKEQLNLCYTLCYHMSHYNIDHRSWGWICFILDFLRLCPTQLHDVNNDNEM